MKSKHLQEEENLRHERMRIGGTPTRRRFGGMGGGESKEWEVTQEEGESNGTTKESNVRPTEYLIRYVL